MILIFCEMEGVGGTGLCEDSLLTFVDLFTSSTVYSELELRDLHSSTMVLSVSFLQLSSNSSHPLIMFSVLCLGQYMLKDWE